MCEVLTKLSGHVYLSKIWFSRECELNTGMSRNLSKPPMHDIMISQSLFDFFLIHTPLYYITQYNNIFSLVN